MKIYLANQSKKNTGGGSSFVRTFTKYARKAGIEFTDMRNADFLFIPSASMIEKEYFDEMQKTKKPILLRIDNILKNSRNRGAGMSRLLKYAKGANKIVFQSSWAKNYLSPWLNKNDVNTNDSIIIYNGGDTEIFFPPAKLRSPAFDYRYLFIKNKRFDEAYYNFQLLNQKNPEARLTIIGRFPQELIENNFDFYDSEKVKYFNQIDDPNTIATIMRNNDVLLFPAFADACPQTIIEARLCEMKIDLVNQVGGTREVMQLEREQITAEYMVNRYIDVFNML